MKWPWSKKPETRAENDPSWAALIPPGTSAGLPVSFPDGMAWEVPFDPEAQDIILAGQSTKH